MRKALSCGKGRGRPGIVSVGESVGADWGWTVSEASNSSGEARTRAAAKTLLSDEAVPGRM